MLAGLLNGAIANGKLWHIGEWIIGFLLDHSILLVLAPQSPRPLLDAVSGGNVLISDAIAAVEAFDAVEGPVATGRATVQSESNDADGQHRKFPFLPPDYPAAQWSVSKAARAALPPGQLPV